MYRMLSAFWIAATAWSEVGLNTPGCGYVLDQRAGVIRPIFGFPGAATAGPRIALEFHAAQAEIRSRLHAALVISGGDDAALYWVREMNRATPQAVRLNAMNGGDLAGWNANGTAAFHYDHRQGRLATRDLRDGEASAWWQFDGANSLGAWTAAAISPNGQCVLAGASANGIGTLHEICRDSQPRLLWSRDGGSASAITYLGDGASALAADRGNDTVTRLDNIGGTPQLRLIAGSASGARAPERMIMLAGGDIVIANGGDPSLLLVQSSAVSRIDLPQPAVDVEYVDSAAVLIGRFSEWPSFLLVDWDRNRTAFLVPPASGESIR